MSPCAGELEKAARFPVGLVQHPSASLDHASEIVAGYPADECLIPAVRGEFNAVAVDPHFRRSINPNNSHVIPCLTAHFRGVRQKVNGICEAKVNAGTKRGVIP